MRGWFDGWKLSLFVACAVLGFAATVTGAIYLVRQQQEQNRESLAREQAARMRERDSRRRGDLQARYITYVLCRSEGRTRRQCRTIAKGTILPPELTLDQIEAKIAELGETTVTKLFVGPPGKQGRVGPGGMLGRQGERGATDPPGRSVRGPRGIQGATGPRGEKGERGSAGPMGSSGARGPAGPPGATGAQGPPGPQGEPGVICAGLRIVTITIPSAGTFKIPVCP